MTDYNHDPLVPRCGLAANLAAAVAYTNEILWTTDTMNLYVEQGGAKILIGGNSGVTCATALVAGYVPYCTTAPNVVDDSPIYTDGTNVGIGCVPQSIFELRGNGASGGLRTRGSDSQYSWVNLYSGTTPDAGWLTFGDGVVSEGFKFHIGVNTPTETSIMTFQDNGTLHVDGVATFDAATNLTGGVVTLYNGLNYIGDSANAFMTVGLTINQGANDDEILAFKSGDVAHGVTDIAETDTWGAIIKRAAAGGMKLHSLSGGTSKSSFWVKGITDTSDTTTSAMALAALRLEASKTSGTGTAGFAADDNLFIVSNSTSAAFIVKGDGDIYYDGADQGAYDAFDDALACQDLSMNLSNQLGKVLKYHKRELNDMGVIAYTIHDSGKEDLFVSTKGMTMLQLGAIGELYRVCNKLCGRMGVTFEEAKRLN